MSTMLGLARAGLLGGLFLLGWQLTSPPLHAAEIKLARHPDFHAGKIVFSYLGDIWMVEEDGSNPRRLTVHKARDTHPRFSPDGKWIAFSSSRYGDPDVFVMPAEGGTPRRLTFYGAPDTVVGWSRDSRRVLFSSTRGRVFPGIPSLYEVGVDGGLEKPLPADWGVHGSYSPNGQRFAYNRHPAVWSRKHYRGSYAADLWVMDVATQQSRRIVDNELADDMKPNNFWPMYRNGEIYFVSDRDVMAKAGSKEVMASKNNIWKVAEDGGQPTQVTQHTSGSLFFPSMSSDGKVIVYEENFGLWKLDLTSGRSVEVKINIASDDKENTADTQTINSEADAFHLSPSGRRAVIATNGELFTIATDRGDVTRLTNTPGAREVQPAWSPDGKLIAFVADRSGREEVWVCDERGGSLKQISDGDSVKTQLTWSPDGKSILYTGSDKKLYRHDFASNKTTVLAQGDVVMFGGSGVMNPQWSPDGQWVSFSRGGDNMLSHIHVIPSTGGQARRITDEDSFSDSGAIWTPDGKRIVFRSGQDIANIGQGNRATEQLHVVSLTKEDKDPTDRNVDSEEQAGTQTPRPAGPGTGRAGGGAPTGAARVEVKIDFDRIGRRSRMLTRVADSIGDMAISPDSRTLVFTTMGTEGGRPVQSIWSVGLDGDRLTRVTQSTSTQEAEDGPPTRGGFGFQGGFRSLQFTRDGRSLYFRQANGIYAVTMAPGTGTGETAGPAAATAAPTGAPSGRGGLAAGSAGGGATPRRVSFAARVETDQRALNRQVFQESWRVMKHRFYDPAMHTVDWNKMKTVYEPLLEFVGDREDVQEVVNMVIGELNASHTGLSGGGGGRGGPGAAAAGGRFPGFELEADASGYYKVTHIYKNGPADKDFVKLNKGDFILAVNDKDLKAGDNYWKAYAEAPTNRLEITINSKATKEGAWKSKLTPVSSTQYANLQYEKWVDDRQTLVDRLSKGEIGYLHIRQMNETSLRKFERDLTTLHPKKALIIDQRFNPGGSIDQELLQILQQKQYQYTRVRDSVEVTRPLRGFFGPMVVMANERSTSDAEVFPDGFRTLKLGKVVGVTTYGAVIGTGSYQMMDGSSIRTPSSGLWNVNGTNLENYGVPPDVYVDNTPADFLKGRDAQLEKAVEVLRGEMKKQ